MDALVLPRRFERLEEAAQHAKKDVSRIVARVESALGHLQDLFVGMHQGDVGGIDIFFGPSGAGKTTFLATCSRFFEGLSAHKIEHSTPLISIASRLAPIVAAEPTLKHLFYLHDRENQRDSSEDIVAFFDDLRRELRRIGPNVLIVWPVSREDYAAELLALAQRTGADSLLPVGNNYYHFEGPPKGDYFSIANDTAKLFNAGRSLSEFGLSEALAKEIAVSPKTIAAYFTALTVKSNEINNFASSLLKKRPRPRVWILVAGDEAKELWGYVRSLTYGNQRALDIPAFTLGLGAERENAQYMKQWQRLGPAMPYILSYLDVRIIEISPRLALAVARSFGAPSVTTNLSSQTTDRDGALAVLRESVLGELLLRAAPVDRSAPRKTEQTATEEYNRLQVLATKKRDGEIHDAFKEALGLLLKDDSELVSITAGKRVDMLGLTPDVFIELATIDPVCLEFTWRTSKPQKTYTPGHIQQYVLNKVFDYVSALGLEKLLDAMAGG